MRGVGKDFEDFVLSFNLSPCPPLLSRKDIMGTFMISCVPSINGWPVGKCVLMRDVGTFVTLLDSVFQIFIVVKDFFSALRTTPSIYPTDR